MTHIPGMNTRGLLVQAENEIDSLKEENASLESRLASLQAEVERLQKELDFIGPLAARMSENAIKIADEKEGES